MMSILWREWRVLSRSLLTMTIHFVTPLFLLVFFATVMGNNVRSFSFNGDDVSYIAYFTPGLVGYVTFMTFQISMTFVRHDRMSGMLGIVCLSSGGLGGYLLGKLTSQIGINVIKAVALVLLATAISAVGVKLLAFGNLIMFALAIVLGTAVWLSLGIAIAMLLKRDDVRELITIMFSLPIAFASSMYYDVTRAPGWILGLSHLNPLTYVCNVARKAYLLPDHTAIDGDVLVLFFMVVVSVLLAFLASKRASLTAG